MSHCNNHGEVMPCQCMQVREQMQKLDEREAATLEYAASSNGAPFPPPPVDEPDWEGMLLEQWVPHVDVIDIHG